MADSMDPTLDLSAQIAQRLQPVAPKASGFYTPSLAERQAAVNAAQGHATQYGGAGLATPTGPVAPGDTRQLGGSGLSQEPLAVRQARIYAAQGGPNLYHGDALTPWGQSFKQAFTPTESQMAKIEARPDLAAQYVNKANLGAQRVADTTARQQQYMRLKALQESARRNPKENAMGALPLLGMMIPGAGAAMGLFNMTQGKNRPQDYLKIASMFL